MTTQFEKLVLSKGKLRSTEEVWKDPPKLVKKGEKVMVEKYEEIKDEDLTYEPWIQTYTGRRFNLVNPKMEDVCIEDIAHSLSNLCRFTGHTREFYSIAQHSVNVSYFCDRVDALYGLLHDASEGLGFNDINSPLKRTPQLEGYRELEKNMQGVIYGAFGLSDKEPASVKISDLLMLATEARDLLSPLHYDWNMPLNPVPFKIEPLSPKEAKALFLNRFDELTK